MENKVQKKSAQRSLGVPFSLKSFVSLALLAAGGLPAAPAQVLDPQLHRCAQDLGEPFLRAITIDIGTGEEIDDSAYGTIITPRRESAEGEEKPPLPDPRDVPQPTLQIIIETPQPERPAAPPAAPGAPVTPLPWPTTEKPKPGADKPN